MTTLPIEKQVVSLKYAKILRDLGVPQESVWYWQELHESLGGGFKLQTSRPPKRNFDLKTAFSAPTVAELGERLPMIYLPVRDDGHNKEWLWSGDGNKHWEYTEANARAKMLIYLIQNNLIKI